MGNDISCSPASAQELVAALDMSLSKGIADEDQSTFWYQLARNPTVFSCRDAQRR